MKLFNFKNLLLFLFLINSIVYSVPMYNQYDPFSYHTIRGINHTYKKQKDKYQASFDLSPFYQYAFGARGNTNSKVPEGDVFGRWNMLGLFYGVQNNTEIKAAPTSKPFVLYQVGGGDQPYIPNAVTQNSYENLSEAWRVLDGKDEGTGVLDPPYNIKKGVDNLDNYYTDPDNYDAITWNKYLPKIYTNYEKFGLRGQVNLFLKKGFGINIKGGLIDYKQTPEVDYDNNFTHVSAATNDGYIYDYLIKEEKLDLITSEVGLSFDAYQETTLEDTHIEFTYQIPFDIMNDDDEHVVTLVPYIAAGLWIPTGKEKNQNAAFSLPTGNDGFWGLTLDGQINFELSDSMLFGFGAGASYFFERDLDDYRIASHEDQQGIFPWTAKITKDPGLLWYFNSTLKAEQFIDNFNAYIDFIYLRHNKDDITMREDDDTRNQYFVPTVNEEDSNWWATMFQGGLEYRFSEGLQMGFGFQAHLSGRRVYRGVTLLGTMSFVF
jgi:hypothetical protein